MRGRARSATYAFTLTRMVVLGERGSDRIGPTTAVECFHAHRSLQPARYRSFGIQRSADLWVDVMQLQLILRLRLYTP